MMIAHLRRVRSALVLLLTAAIVAALAGCGGGSSGGGGGGALDVWVRGAGDAQKAYSLLLAAFTKKTGVKTKLFMTLTDFETKLNAAASSHNLPDVVVDDAAQTGNFRSMGIIEKVDRSSITGADKLSDRAWAATKDLSGDYYAVPFSAQADVLLIRTDWLKKLHLQTPRTWEQLRAVAKAFTTQDPDGDGKADTYGLAVPGSTNRGYISWFWSTFLWQAGGDYFKQAGNGKYGSAIGSAQAVTAAKYFEQLFCTDKSVQPGALNDVTADSNKVWQSGTAGMYLTGPYAYPTSDATSIKGKYTAVAPPAGPANAQTLAEGTNTFLMAGSSHTKQAKQLAEFMITPQAQKLGATAVPSSTIVRLPVITSLDAASEHHGDPRWKLAQQVYADSGHYEPDFMPNWSQFRQATSDALNKMISSCADPQAALSQLNDTFTSLLQKQGVAAG